MARGLDVGTMNIVSARQDGDETVFFGQRNSFVEIEYSDMAEQMLSRSDVLHIRKGDEVYVVGDDSLNFANVFNQETRRPMQHGILSSDEKSAIPMIKLIIEQVLGEPTEPGERVYFSSPADPVDSDLSTLYHRKTLESFIGDMGYDPEPINEGMAVIYSELADSNFTGLGISFGAGMTNVCLAYYAVPVMQFSIDRGGDWIDEQTANATGTNVDKVTSIKEDDFRLDFTTDAGGVEGALSIYYDNLLDYVIENIKQELDEEDVEEGLDVPVVVTGGTASPQGFEELFADRLREAGLPFTVSGVSKASEPLYSVARGALVASRTEEDESDSGNATGTEEDTSGEADGEESPEEPAEDGADDAVDEATDGAEAPAED